MQRKSHLALAIVLLLSLSSPVYAAAPKAGSKCTKAGQTSTSAGIKYTCVKSGKNLVWNKGVVVKAPNKPEPTAPAKIEDKDLLPVDSRIMPASELTSIDVCKTQDKTPDYQLLGKVLHKNGFPRPANSLSGKKSAKVLVIPLVFNNLQFKSVKTQTGQLLTSDLEILNEVIPRVKEDFKRLSAGRFEITIDVLPQSQWWVINSDNPLKYGPQLNNFPEIVNIIEKNKPDFKFDVYDSYIFLTGNGEPGQPGLGSGQAAFGDEIRNSTGNFNAVLMAGGYNGTYIWIHELGHSLYAFEDLYLFNPSASTNKNTNLDVPARWDLMAGSSMSLLQWNKYLMGWIYDSEVRCLSDQKSSIHYLSALATSADPKMLAINLAEGVTLAAEARTGTSDGAGLLLYTINTYIGHGNGPILAQKSLVAKGQTRAMLGWEFKVLETNTKGILFSATKTDIDKFVPPASEPKTNQNNPDPQQSVINVTRGDIVPNGSLKGRATWNVTGHESYRLYVTAADDFQKVYFETGIVNDSRNPLVVDITGLVCNKELRTVTMFYSKKNGEGERKVIESRQLTNLPCP